MNKKKIIYLSVILIFVLVVLYFFSQKNSEQAQKDLNLLELEEDASLLSKTTSFLKNLNPIEPTALQKDHIKNKYDQKIWDSSLDFYNDLYPLVKKDPEEYFHAAQKLVKKIAPCLGKKDLCGQTKNLSEDEAFFPLRTNFHFKLEKALEVMNLAIQQNPYLWSEVDFESMLDSLKTRHNNSAVIATQIIFSGQAPNNIFKKTLKVSKNLSYLAQPTALTIVAQSKHMENKNLRKHFLDHLSSIIENGSFNLIYNIQKRIYRFNLKPEEFKSVAKGFCSLKNKTDGPNHIYLKVKLNLSKVSRFYGWDFDMNEVCNES